MKTEPGKDKVLHICPDFPNTKLYNLLISRLEGDYRNVVYVPSCPKEVPAPFPVEYLGRDFGIVDRLLFFRKQRIIKNDIERKGLCEGKQMIHAHILFTGGYVARKLSKKYGIPYIVAVRNTDVNVFFKYMPHLRHIGVNIMRDAVGIVFISPAYREYVIREYVPSKYRDDIQRKSHVIPNGIDDFFLDNSPQKGKRLFDKNGLKLIFVGEVNNNKNVKTTLKACEILEKKGFEPKLTIVGRISDTLYNGVKENRFVQYYPQSPKEVVLEHLRENDIFVMPSLHETFGLVYIEALSQGLPIVYSKGQGVDGYFDEGLVGYHVEATNPNEIVESIEKIVADYSVISKRCIEASKPFSWNEISKVYADIYNKLLN